MTLSLSGSSEALEKPQEWLMRCVLTSDTSVLTQNKSTWVQFLCYNGMNFLVDYQHVKY